MELLDLADGRWETYRAGYNRAPYNVVPLIRQLLQSGTSKPFWDEVWAQLHHQGDLGEASYALVPYLALYLRTAPTLDAMLLAYAAVVEIERPRNGNPPVPHELEDSYAWALTEILALAAVRFAGSWADEQIRYFAALAAAIKGHPVLAQAYQDMSIEDARKFLAAYYDDDSWLHDV